MDTSLDYWSNIRKTLCLRPRPARHRQLVMGGRPPKSDDQVVYEKQLARRLVALRKAAFPESGEVEGRREFAELIGLSETAYEKLEQRGALSAYHISLICENTLANPYLLLSIPASDRRVSHFVTISEDDRRQPPRILSPTRITKRTYAIRKTARKRKDG